MGPTYKIIDSDKLKEKTVLFKCPSVIISKNIRETGFWFKSEYYRTDLTKNSGTKHFILQGSYEERTGTLIKRSAGWKSWEDEEVHPAGIWYKECKEPCTVWCAWPDAPNTRVDHVFCNHLQKDETFIIPNNTYIFCATGKLLLENNTELDIEKLYSISTGNKLVTVKEESYYFYWSNILQV